MQNLTPDVRAYIDTSRASGFTNDAIRQALIATGWETASVDYWLSDSSQTQPSSLVVPQAPVTPATSMAIAESNLAPTKVSLAFNVLAARAIVILKEQWRSLLKLNLAVFAVALLLVEPAVVLQSIQPGKNVGLSIALAIGGYFGIWLLSLAYMPTAFHMVAGHQEKIGVGEAWNRGKRHIWTFFSLSLLSGLVLMGGMVMLIVPGFIWSLSFTVLFWIPVTENVRGFSAIMRVRQLAREDGGAIIWSGFIISILSFGVGLLQTYLTSLAKASDMPILDNGLSVIGLLVQMVVVMPFMLCFSYAMFETLKVKRADAPPVKSGTIYKVAAALGLLQIIAIIVATALSAKFLISLPMKLSGKTGQHSASAGEIGSSDLAPIKAALVAYYKANGKFPKDLDELTFVFPSTTPEGFKETLDYDISVDGTWFQLFYPRRVVGGKAKGETSFMLPKDLQPELVIPEVVVAPEPEPSAPVVPAATAPDASHTPEPAPVSEASVPVAPAVAMPDADNDGLSDKDEVDNQTDPANPDTDGDGLADGDEVHAFVTSPLQADTAGSSYTDGQSYKNGYDPTHPGNKLTPEDIRIIRGRAQSAGGFHQPTFKTLGASSSLLK